MITGVEARECSLVSFPIYDAQVSRIVEYSQEVLMKTRRLSCDYVTGHRL